jgi:hypothetical protein
MKERVCDLFYWQELSRISMIAQTEEDPFRPVDIEAWPAGQKTGL